MRHQAMRPRAEFFFGKSDNSDRFSATFGLPFKRSRAVSEFVREWTWYDQNTRERTVNYTPPLVGLSPAAAAA